MGTGQKALAAKENVAAATAAPVLEVAAEKEDLAAKARAMLEGLDDEDDDDDSEEKVSNHKIPPPQLRTAADFSAKELPNSLHNLPSTAGSATQK